MIARSVMILFASTTPLVAQNLESSIVCWSARPLANCKGWVVTEIGFESAFASTIGPPLHAYSRRTRDFATRVTLTIGRMKNTKPDEATGFTVSVASNEPDQYYRAELRRRIWVAEDQSVEYSAGLATRSLDAAGLRSPRASGATGGVSLGLGPIGLDARADLLWGTGRPVVGLSAGATAGGKVMPVATLGLGLFLLYALATMS